ncbi:DMT family transporter [Candidatus Thorarchaeota archaeon]|nr:MAG: DMT family transporter [Candidatus Thorarchaeota archaeon]
MLAAIILLWGTNFVVARFLSGIDPIRVSGILYGFFRYFIGAITMIVVLAYNKQGFTDVREEIAPYKKMLILSAFASAIFVMTLHMSVEFISSGTSSIIVNLCPIIVLIYGVYKFKERLTPMKVMGFALGLIGGLLFLWNSLILSPGLELGIFFALMAMIAWGAYTITLHYLEGANRYIVMTVKHLVSSIMILPFIYLVLLEGTVLILVFDVWSIIGLLFSGILASGLAYVLYFSAVEVIGAPKASSFLFLVPFVSVVGDFVLGEPPEFITLLAGIIAIIGVAFVRFAGVKESEETDQ